MNGDNVCSLVFYLCKMEKLLQAIKKEKPLADDLIAAIQAAFQHNIVAKSQILLKENQYCRRLYFLESGTIRTYYYAKDKDVSSWFYQEGQFFAAWASFYSQQPSYEYIEALEECSVYFIDYYSFNQLLDTHPQFERFGRILAQDLTVFIDQFSKGYMFLSAKEKYDLLLSIFPDITQRVNLGHIASFLGISQETLSRIRKTK